MGAGRPGVLLALRLAGSAQKALGSRAPLSRVCAAYGGAFAAWTVSGALPWIGPSR